MSGFPSSLEFLIVAMIVISLGVALKRWYGKDAQRSLFVLCLMLAFVSPWLALAVFFAAKFPGVLFRRSPRIQGN
jgi:hypothetical protein